MHSWNEYNGWWNLCRWAVQLVLNRKKYHHHDHQIHHRLVWFPARNFHIHYSMIGEKSSLSDHSHQHVSFIIVGPNGCRPYSGFSVSFSFFLSFFNFGFLPITKRHSGLPYCREGQRSMKCGDSKMVSARWWRQDCDGEREKARWWYGEIVTARLW